MPILLVAGNLLSTAFHEAKVIAEDIVEKDANLDLETKGHVEVAWLKYLEKLRGELNNSSLRFQDPAEPVIIHSVIGYIGGLDELMLWANKTYKYADPRVHEGYDQVRYQLGGMTKTAFTSYINSSQHDFVELVFDIADTQSADNRVVIELFNDVCPKTCANFLALCTGHDETQETKDNPEKLSYLKSPIHRIVQDGWLQGGDIVNGSGATGKSIYGDTFGDEAFTIPHDQQGVVSMANSGPHTNSSQFFITMKALPFFDQKNVAFGQVICGFDVLARINSQPTANQRPVQPVTISSCGQVNFSATASKSKGVEDHQTMNTPRSINRNDATLIVLGLDSAGKSTLVKNFIDLPKDMYYSAPTIGFEREELRYDHFDLVFYGLGGGEGFRGIWTHYYDEVFGLVYVIDASDAARFDEAKQALDIALTDPRLKGKPVLIYANKQDQPSAVTATELSIKLKIDELKDNPVRVVGSVALPAEYNANCLESDPALFDGMSWLCRQVESDYESLTVRVGKDKAARKAKEAQERAAKQAAREAEAKAAEEGQE